MKRTIISIRNNDFKISPKLENDDENCKYCDFKEICYLRAYQKRKINNSDGGEDNDGME